MISNIRTVRDDAVYKIKRANDIRLLNMLEEEYLGEKSVLSRSAKTVLQFPPEIARQSIIEIEKARKDILRELKKRTGDLKWTL